MESEKFLVISKEEADLIFPEGWTEDELKEKGFLINKPINEDDLSLWDDVNSRRG
jgi:hypothetical protein